MANKTKVASSRTALLGATGPSIPAGGTVETRGFLTEGDGGGGLYREVSAPATALQTNPGFIHIVGDRWLQLLPQNGNVSIEQFGGKADYVASGSHGTDNYQPLLNAIKFTAFSAVGNPAVRYTHRIRFGSGEYWIGSTVYVYDHIHIEGNSTFQADHTTLHFPNNVSGFVFHQINTGPGGAGLGENGNVGGLGESQGSLLSGLTLDFGTGGAIVDLTKKAIYARTSINLQNINIFNAPGKGVYYRAYAGYGGDLEGNANQWNVINLYVHSCKGDAFHVEGADTNGGAMFGFRTHVVGGCGIRNESWLPNYYAGLQITGYGNMGVAKDGKLYVLINPSAGKLVSAGGVVPGTDNNSWYYMGAGSASSQFPTWVDDGSHVPKNPIYDSGGGSHYYNPYVEVGGAAIIAVNVPSEVHGGTCPSTTLSGASGNGMHNRGVGTYLAFAAGSPEYPYNGTYAYARIGGGSVNAADGVGLGQYGGVQFLTHSRQKDGDYAATWGYSGTDITYGYLNAVPYWQQTTPTTAATFGRTLPQPFRLVLYDHVMQDPTNSNNGRMTGARDAAPTQSGAYARGDRYYNVNPAPGGPEGWVCTTSGAIPNLAWSSGVYVDLNTWLLTTAGRVYSSRGGGISTVEPVHTSGTVTGSDGIPWIWAGSSVPVFTAFGRVGTIAGPPYNISDVTGLQTALDSKSSDNRAINTQTGTSYTLALTDKGGLVARSNASANTTTVPANGTVPFPVGSQVDILQDGAGQSTVAAAGGVTIQSKGGALKTTAQYSAMSLVKKATDTWWLFGDITT